MMVDYDTKHALPPQRVLLLSRVWRPPSAASAVEVCTKWSRSYGPDGILVEADSARDCATHRRCD